LTAAPATGSISEYILPDRAWYDFVCPWNIAIHAATAAGVAQQIQPWVNLAFAGSVLATLFWVSLDRVAQLT